MKNVVSFSGGRSSALLVYLMKNQYPDTDFVFMDTGAEHPKTYEFVKNLVKYWGIKLTCLRVVVNSELGHGNRTGNQCGVIISHILDDTEYLRDGYVMLSIGVISRFVLQNEAAKDEQ